MALVRLTQVLLLVMAPILIAGMCGAAVRVFNMAAGG